MPALIPAAMRVAVLDAPAEAQAISSMLRGGGFGTTRLVSGCAELALELTEGRCDLVVADPAGAGVDPVALADHVAEAEVPMVLTGPPAPAAEGVAIARVAKPLDERMLLIAARQARLTAPRPQAAPDRTPFAAIIGSDPALLRAVTYAATVAASAEPVLITGETGTGKDLVAQALHAASGRAGEFVAVNVAGFDDTLFSDSLFGHRKGAFTGASDPRLGLVLRASAGTLFLDEIGDLSVASQVKLLRLLEDGAYYPLGADMAKRSTARVVAATSVAPDDLRGGARMRLDLYYRLRVHHVHLPPLRDRRDDLPALADAMLRAASLSLRRRVDPCAGLIDVLRAHPWPGNVRELRAVLFDAAVRAARGVVDLDDVRCALGPAPQAASAGPAAAAPASDAIAFPATLPSLELVQDQLVAEALRRAGGNQAEAARLIGITRQGLHKRLARP